MMVENRQTSRTPRPAAVMMGGLVLALTTLTACGVESGSDPLPALDVAAAPEAHFMGELDAQANVATQTLEARHARWRGDVEVAQAAAVISAYYDNAGITDCIEESGLTSPWEEAIQPVHESSVFDALPQMAPPVLRHTDEAQTNVQADALLEDLWELPPEPLNSVGSECTAKAADYKPSLLESYDEEGLTDLVMPPVRSTLAESWQRETEKVADQLGVTQEEFEKCLEQTDLPAAFEDLGGDVTLDSYELVAVEALDTAQAPMRGKKGGAAWRRATEVERSLRMSAWECTREHYDRGIALLDKAMDRFEASNTTKIRQAMAANQRILDIATDMGWSSEMPIGAISDPENDQ